MVLFIAGPQAARAALENVGNQAAMAHLAATGGSLSFRDSPFGACEQKSYDTRTDQPASKSNGNLIHWAIPYLRSLVLAADGDFSTARDLLSNTRRSTNWLLLGAIEHHLGHKVEAIRAWQLGGVGSLFIRQGQVCLAVSDFERARSYYDVAVQSLPPNQPQEVLLLIEFYTNHGWSRKDLLPTLVKYLNNTSSPDDVRSLIAMGRLLMAQGQYEEALSLFTQAQHQGLSSGSPEAFYQAGIAAFNLNRLAEARAYWESAIEAQPDDRRPYRWIGHSYAHEGNLDAAFEWYQKASSLEDMGATRLTQGRYEEALQYYLEASKTDQRGHIWYGAGQAAMGLEQWQLARELMEKAVIADPKVMYRLQLAGACRQLGDIACARDQYQAVLVVQPNNEEAEAALHSLQ